MTDVFISYSRRDKAFMERFFEALKAYNLDAWVDWDNIPKGADWLEEIYAGIEASDTFILIISNASLSSEVCNLEIAHAFTHKKRIMPVIYQEPDDGVFLEEWYEKEWEAQARANWTAIKHINWQFFRPDDDFDAAFAQLIEALETDLVYVKAHTRLGVRAIEWQKNNRQPEFLLRGVDLAQAEAWLDEGDRTAKLPGASRLQQDYIRVSRLAEDHQIAEAERVTRQVNNLQRARIGFAIIGFIAIVVAIGAALFANSSLDTARTAEQQENQANTQVADANTTLTSIPPTIDYANTQAGDANLRANTADAQANQANTTLTGIPPTINYANTQAQDANQRANSAGTQANQANSTLTQIPPTLTSVNNDIVTAEAKGTQIALNQLDSQSLFTASLAEQQLQQGYYYDALRLALEANKDYPTIYNPEAHQALINVMNAPARKLNVIEQREDITELVWSADATRVLTWSTDGLVYIWNAVTGEAELEIAYGDDVTGAIWNSDETQILTWSKDDTAQVWDVSTEQQLLRLNHTNDVTGATWNSDETQILTWSKDGTARIWDTTTGDVVFSLKHSDEVRGAKWNRSEAFILTYSANDSNLRVWNAKSGEEMQTLEHEGDVISAYWSENGTRILARTQDYKIHIWDTVNHTHDIAVIGTQMNGMRWNNDETLVLIWTSHGMVYVWNPADKVIELSLTHSDFVWGAWWNTDKTKILVSTSSNTVWVWDAATGQPLLSLRHDDFAFHAGWNADSTQIMTFAGDNVYLWDAETGGLLLMLSHKAAVLDAIWNSDETQILVRTKNDKIHIWDVSQAFPHFKLTADNISFFDWNSNETLLLVGLDKRAEVWDIATGQRLIVLEHDSFVSFVAWNGDDTQIITNVNSKNLYGWDVASQEILWKLAHDDTITGRHWNSDETQLLTYSTDHTARVWDAKTGELLFTLPHEYEVWGGRWSHDESQILTRTEEGTAHIWDAATGRLLHVLEHESAVRDIFWSADDKLILTRAGEKALVWDSVTGELVLSVTHDIWLYGVSWNSDERLILTWSFDKTARVWSAETGELLLTLVHDGEVRSAQWNADETLILTHSSPDATVEPGTVKVWDATTGELQLTLITEEYPRGVMWNADETQILTWSNDGNVKVWDATTGELYMTLALGENVGSVIWNKDFTQLMTKTALISDTERIDIWLMDYDQLREIGQTWVFAEFSDAEREAFFLLPLTPTPN